MSRIASSRPVKLGSSLPRHDRAMAGQGLGLMVALALAVLPGALAAQTQSAPVQTLPGLDSYSLPSGRPTPVPEPAPTIGPMVRPTPTPPPAPTPVPPPAAPAPTARPAARPTPVPSRSAPAPRPTPTATPATTRTAPAPVPRPSASPTAAPPVLAPAPLPVPSAAAPVPPAPAPAQVSSGGSSTGWWIGGAVLLLAALAGAGMLLRRRRADEDHVEEQPLAESPSEEAPVAEPVAPAPSMLRSRNRSAPEPAAVPQPRPRITIAFTARRAGTNLTSAAVDYEVTLTNSGDLGARAVTLAILILTAYAGQDRELDGFFAAPIDQPPAPPFDLPPGESVTLAGMGLLPLDRVNALTVQGVAMFVPVMAVNVLYGWGEIGTGQDAEAFLIGLDRGGETKLAPFRLDQGPRMFTEVAVRPHGDGRRR